MSGGHYREECKHGRLIAQCRCSSPGKAVRVFDPCPFPDCPPDQPDRRRPDSSDLDGASDLGDPAAWPSTPGEFAARWNAWDEEKRAEVVRALIQASERSTMCLLMHRGRFMAPLDD